MYENILDGGLESKSPKMVTTKGNMAPKRVGRREIRDEMGQGFTPRRDLVF